LLRTFGEDDADTLTSMGNLAALLWQGGEREEAFAVQEHVAGALRRTRGDADPAAQTARAVLDSMLREAGL